MTRDEYHAGVESALDPPISEISMRNAMNAIPQLAEVNAPGLTLEMRPDSDPYKWGPARSD